MMIVFYTQYRENYGFHNGGPDYWKNKWGDDYVLENFTYTNHDDLMAVVAAVRDKLDYANEASEQYVLDWEIVDNDYKTQWEKDNLEYDKRVVKSPRVVIDDVKTKQVRVVNT